MRFPERWALLPLLIEATPAVEAGVAGVAAAGAVVMVVTFLQLIGVTDRIDRNWRFRKLAPRTQPDG